MREPGAPPRTGPRHPLPAPLALDRLVYGISDGGEFHPLFVVDT
jgi:hypothetical protein